MPHDMSVPFMIFSNHHIRSIGRRFSSFGKILAALRPSLSNELASIGAELEPEWYAAASFFSAVSYGFLFFLLVFLLSVTVGFSASENLPPFTFAFLSALLFFLIFFFLHLFYPGIIQRKIAIRENKDLLFALQEMVMSIESGVTLFDAMKNISTADYGYVSNDFARVIKLIQSGSYEKDALRELAVESKNDYMKRAAWQIINSLESGSRLSNSLTIITDALEKQILREIRNYSAALNFIMLVYMMVAAAIPSLGITFMVLLSAFGGAGITSFTMLSLIGATMFVQIIIIGYARSTRPEIFSG